MESCIFCKIAKGEIKPEVIWENDSYIAFLDTNPIAPGHTLVIPKKHTGYIFDLDDRDYAELMLNAKKIAQTLKTKLNSKRVGLVVEGFNVPHVHVHLMPVNEIGDMNPKNIKPAKIEELKKVAEKILVPLQITR